MEGSEGKAYSLVHIEHGILSGEYPVVTLICKGMGRGMYSLLILDDFNHVFLYLIKLVGGGAQIEGLAFFLGITP